MNTKSVQQLTGTFGTNIDHKFPQFQFQRLVVLKDQLNSNSKFCASWQAQVLKPCKFQELLNSLAYFEEQKCFVLTFSISRLIISMFGDICLEIKQLDQ